MTRTSAELKKEEDEKEMTALANQRAQLQRQPSSSSVPMPSQPAKKTL